MSNSGIFPNYSFNPDTGLRENFPDDIPTGSRVLCLYRVSTDKQLYYTEDHKADIPHQRRRCREFAERQGWVIVCELQEEGVSGFKVRAEKRDKIQVIKDYARQGKFDILLVHMFDRIGRIADETPFVVEWLCKMGIRVWSAEEGEQRIESHTDKLMNYIRFWQADGESQKTSIRTTNSLNMLTEAGCFTGGTCPYGYQLVHTGRTNKRKQPVYDLAICEEEVYQHQIMFRLARYEGYGAQRIANYLNAQGYKNRAGKNWHPATIQHILKNPICIGIIHNGNARSETIEKLRITDDETFWAVQNMLAERSRSNEATRSKPLNTRGRSLLAGMIFCGHCGCRLCVTTSGKGRRRADGTDERRMRYTCQTKSRTHGDCDGQTGYTVSKLDEAIDTILRGVFARVNGISRDEIITACQSYEIRVKHMFLKQQKRELEKETANLAKLKSEIVKALAGESSFTPALLQEVISGSETRISEIKKALLDAERAVDESEKHTAEIAKKYDQILEWAYVYDNASMSAKKMIVSNLIERVDVRRGYDLKIKFSISLEQFLVSLANVA